MNRIIVLICLCSSSLVAQLRASDNSRDDWSQFAKSGKGAIVVKAIRDGKVTYWFVPGTNRLLNSSELNGSFGVQCASLEDAAAFIAKRPRELVLLIMAQPMMRDDAKILHDLTDDEMLALGAMARSEVSEAEQDKGSGTKSGQPGATDNPDDAQ